MAKFELEAPEAVEVLTEEEAQEVIDAKLPVSVKTKQVLDTKVTSFVGNLTHQAPNSPEFLRQLDNVLKLGEKEVASTAQISSRMLDRPMSQGQAASPQMKVAGSLQELRQQVTELDPARADLKGAKKLLKFLPGGNKIDAYFNRYASAKSHLDAITQALLSGQEELQKDNADIKAYQGAMWTDLGKLNEWNTMLAAMDAYIVEQAAQATARGETELAHALETEALNAVRQRRMDIQTQITVATQGYLALNLVKKNNDELIRGVDRARTTTMAAMQTAIVVAQALDVQAAVLAQINALNATTSDMIVRTSERLKTQGAAIQEQASNSMVQVEKLELAFQNIYEAMDAVDNFKKEANVNLLKSTQALEAQVAKARPRLEREHARALEA